MATVKHQLLRKIVDAAVQGQAQEEVGFLKVLPEILIKTAGLLKLTLADQRNRRDDPS